MGDSSEFRSTLDDSAAVQLTGKIMVGAIIVLFLVVVFVLFLHLYAKWFWSRGQDGTLSSRNDILLRRRRRFVFAQDPALAALRRGLDPSVLRSIPVLIFRSQDFKDGLECAVCLSEVSEGEKARLIPKCNHGFHVECIDMWFQSHSTCPLCRNPVESPEEDHNSGVGGSPNFPTNVLFWGNETEVSTGGEGPSSTTSSSRPTADGMLVIDIPNKQVMSENFAEEEAKSPMTTRLRSLKRLLSGDKRLLPCTPSSVDVDHQVVAVRGQTSKSTLDVV